MKLKTYRILYYVHVYSLLLKGISAAVKFLLHVIKYVDNILIISQE